MSAKQISFFSFKINQFEQRIAELERRAGITQQPPQATPSQPPQATPATLKEETIKTPSTEELMASMREMNSRQDQLMNNMEALIEAMCSDKKK